jgi:predicted nucleotidyltransferase
VIDVRGPALDRYAALIDAAIYGAIFGSPVTLDELWRYARVAVDLEDLRSALARDPVLRRVIDQHEGLYFLRDANPPRRDRRERIDRSRRLAGRARRVCRVLRHVPFVRGLALTGSVAAADAGEDADVDLLVLVDGTRLGTVFLLLASLSRLVGRRILCPNYYVSTPAPSGETDDPYVARELAQTRLLAGDSRDWARAAGWVRSWFPNAVLEAEGGPMSGGGAVQGILERLLSGRLGAWLERRGAATALRRLSAHHARFNEVPPSTVIERLQQGLELRFHGGGLRGSVVAQYVSLRARVLAALEEACLPNR